MNKTIFIILAVTLAVTVLFLAAFVGFETGPQSQFRIKSDENIILFGVTPWGDQKLVKAAYKPLLDYMGKRLDKKIQLLVMEDYEIAVDDLVEGVLDISVISPVCLIRAKARDPSIQYISTVAREAGGKLSATFKGYLVALRSKYPGMKIDDFLKDPGRYNFAFVTKSSASGFAYPMAMFKKLGIDPDTAFKSVTVFENHPAMTDALAAGKIDLGATWEYNLERAVAKHGNIFEIVWTTQDIPGLSWVASSKLDPVIVEKVRQIQKEINASENLRTALLKDTPDKGWIAVDPKTYDEVKEVMKYAGEFK